MADRDRFGRGSGGNRGLGSLLNNQPGGMMPPAHTRPGQGFPRYPGRRPPVEFDTIPEGFNPPDRFGRRRPILPNPFEGANIGGGYGDEPSPRIPNTGRMPMPWYPYNPDRVQPLPRETFPNPKYTLEEGPNTFPNPRYTPGPSRAVPMGSNDILDMEILPGLGYDAGDEYEFDKRQGYKNRIWGIDPDYGDVMGDMSYHSQPHPLPVPGIPQPRRPFPGMPSDDWMQMAQADFNWRTWDKLRKTFGQESADKYLETFNLNRGGIIEAL
jgi:hypothetical protein